MDPASATLSEVLTALRGPWSELAKNIHQDATVLWIGSGISREKFPSVGELIKLLLERLHGAQDAANPSCPYRSVAQTIIRLSTVTGIDLSQAPAAWDPAKLKELLIQLSEKYADVLQIPLQVGPCGQSLPWDFLKLQEIYSDPTVTPDAEHRFLALLIAERALSEVITTNWDPLIERAYSAIGCSPAAQVASCAAELNQSGAGCLVLKIHGCAAGMHANPTRYRPFMVATRNDINQWNQRETFQPFREKVRAILRAKPAIFVGISGQDFNLQAECVTTAIGDATYPPDPPRIMFTVSEIGAPQRAILNGVYGSKYLSNAASIDPKAALPLYGKPLLGGLFVLLLFEKLACLLDRGETQFPSDGARTLARSGLQAFEQILTARFDVITDPLERWRTLATEVPAFVARLLGLYRLQAMPGTIDTYHPIDLHHPALMRLDPNLPATNLHWLILAMAAFNEGRRRAVLVLRTPVVATGEDGQLRVEVAASGEVAVFFLKRAESAQHQLEAHGVLKVGSGRRVLLVYPAGGEPARLKRSPARRLPGAGPPNISEVWLEDLANDAHTADDLIDMLRSALIAAVPI